MNYSDSMVPREWRAELAYRRQLLRAVKAGGPAGEQAAHTLWRVYRLRVVLAGTVLSGHA